MTHKAIQAVRLTIYCNETDHYRGRPLFDWLVGQALDKNLCGATVFKGLSGFGRHRHLHHGHLLDLASNLPMAVEIIDQRDSIDAFLAHVADAIRTHTYILEDIHWHQPAKRKDLE